MVDSDSLSVSKCITNLSSNLLELFQSVQIRLSPQKMSEISDDFDGIFFKFVPPFSILGTCVTTRNHLPVIKLPTIALAK